MAICPFALWRPVVNYTPIAIAHVGVVIHVTAGESDPWGWFNNPTAQASSHFFIGNGQGGVPDGQLEQYVDTTFKAWAEAAGNTSYVSVETEGEPTEALTAKQVAAFGRLYAWLHQLYGIPFVITDTPGHAGFITHGDGGAAWGGHTDCPGPLRSPQRTAILAAANGPAPAPPPAPKPAPPVVYPGDNVQATPITFSLSGGNGWAPCPVPAAKVANVVVLDENPENVGRYDNIPVFRGVATQASKDAPNGALVFSGFVDGTFGAVVWSVS